MNAKFSKTLLIFAVLLILSYEVPYCLSQGYSRSYQLLDSPTGSTYYRLNVLVSDALYDYYFEKSHRLSSNDDFAKFVTPHALKPVADSLWQIYSDDEDFANGILMIVHQIPYNETLPVKYPIETIVENKGDCDLFSYIAVSIMKAGGLDVVLLYYESKAHMNIGIHLLNTPKDARGEAYYVTYNDTRYYVAECTGGNWEEGWRVGECPDDLKHVPAEVITLEDCEEWAPSQVSASYKNLQSSIISLTISSSFVIQESLLTLSGQLSPAFPNKTVTIYIKINNSPWTVLDKLVTDSSGQYTYVMGAQVPGVYDIRASWSGDNDYAAADSPILNVIVLSTFFILLLAVILILACLSIFVFLISRRTQQGVQEPRPPEYPY